MTTLTDTVSAGTLQASGVTFTITGLNMGTVRNLSGAFSGMQKLSDIDQGEHN